MAIAPPRLTHREAELVERLLSVVDALSADEFEQFRASLQAALEPGRPGRAFMDMLESWEWMLKARKDPEHHKRIARVREPLGEALTVDEIKQRFARKR